MKRTQIETRSKSRKLDLKLLNDVNTTNPFSNIATVTDSQAYSNVYFFSNFCLRIYL
jgi:hypothetical protein